MLAFIIRRLLWLIPVLLLLSFITFGLMHIAPGGPWDTDPSRRQLDPRTEKALNEKFGLDKPIFFNTNGNIQQPWTYLDSQYFNYVWKIVRYGDFGPSYRRRGVDVVDILKQGVPYSLKLGLMAFAWSVTFGILIGITAALHQNTWVDYVSLFSATILRSTPTFVLGILLIIVFASTLKWVSVIQEDWSGIKPFILPAICLGAATAAFVARLTRSSMLDVTRQDYIRTARAKGVGERSVVYSHMLKNALIPVVTILGPALAALVTGSFIIENLFGVPGIGRLFIEAINARDYSMIMATTLLYAFLVAIGNLLVDITYAFIDPRIRLS